MAILSIKQQINIYFVHMEWAEALFDKIIEEQVPKEDIVCFRKDSNYGCYCRLKSGDVIRTVRASQNSRGVKSTKVFMEPGIDKEIVDCIIRPSIMFTMQTVYDEDLRGNGG